MGPILQLVVLPDQTCMNGLGNRLRSGTNTKLVLDRSNMEISSAFTDSQLASDSLRRMTSCGEGEHLEFSFADLSRRRVHGVKAIPDSMEEPLMEVASK